MQRYLISYEFTDGEDQEEGAEMLINWYESGGPQNRPENYEVHSWIFMVQNGIGHSVVSALSCVFYTPNRKALKELIAAWPNIEDLIKGRSLWRKGK